MSEREPVSRVGTARVLVLLGSALQLAASGVLTFLVLVFGPVLIKQASTTWPVIAFVVVSLVTIALANWIALRTASARTVMIGGCGTLLAGTVLGAGLLLALITLR